MSAAILNTRTSRWFVGGWLCHECLNKIPIIENTPSALTYAGNCFNCGGWSVPPIPMSELQNEFHNSLCELKEFKTL